MTGVRSLASLHSEPNFHFGNKAVNLSQILSSTPEAGCVLPGFCVTFDMHKDLVAQMQDFDPEIRQCYHELLKSNDCKTVVVRSSADREDGREALFPGVLKSFTSVSTISELRSAIQECTHSAWTSAVKRYADARGVDSRFDFFTVLVQVELQSEYAGVAFTRLPLSCYYSDTMITQLTHGSNHNLVKGLGRSNTYSLICSQAQITYRCLDQAFFVDRSLERQILEMLFQLMLRLKAFFQDQLDVEWGYAHGKLYIYQARFFKTAELPRAKSRSLAAFAENQEQGLKYQAMSFFVRHNMFQREVFFFPKKTPVSEIRSSLLDRAENAPVTVRFSCGHDIGLPRVFADAPDEAAAKIEALKERDWSVIAYRSLDVKESYELYLDREKAVLEYVPGMWESDSRLVADVAVLTDRSLCFWLAKDDRIAKYEDCTGVWRQCVQPTTRTKAYNRFRNFLPFIRELRALFKNDLPLNFHFVSDGEHIYFLNCRLSKEINWTIRNDKELYIVRKVSDCAGWDGRSAILFRPNLRRGEEASISSFIPFLKKTGCPIYVEFGILSHPAIMLREFGISVLPRFNSHSFYKVSNHLFNCLEEENESQAGESVFDTHHL